MNLHMKSLLISTYTTQERINVVLNKIRDKPTALTYHYNLCKWYETWFGESSPVCNYSDQG